MDDSSDLEIFQDLQEDEHVPFPDPANYEPLNNKRSKNAANLEDLIEKYLKSV